MAANDHSNFQTFDQSPLGLFFSETFMHELPLDPTVVYAFHQDTILYKHADSGNGSLPVPYRFDERLTASDASNYSTPLPPSDSSGSDNELPPQGQSELKRKAEPLNGTSSNKRPKPTGGHAHDMHTVMNRKTGACLPCQMRTNKHRCLPGPDPNGPCLACWKKANAVGRTICQRARFQDVKIIRLGPSRDFANTLRWLKDQKPPQDLQKAEWRKVTDLPVKKGRHGSQGRIELPLSQGHSERTLNLRVQEFDPVETDKTDYPWFDGEGVEHVYKCPHYAIADREHATKQVRYFIESNAVQYLHKLLPVTSDPGSRLARMAFRYALDRARESSLVDLTINFWVAGRLIEDPWSIRGRETLGMAFDPLPESPFSQRIPVTPIMDFQIDNIVIYDHLVDTLHRIRKAMKEKIMPRKQEDWFDLHLATFILLHHVDLTMKHDVDFATNRNLPRRFSNRPLIEMITFGANALLSFHQHEKGHFPLSAPDWSEVERGHSFNDVEKSYLVEARRLIQQIDVPRKAGDDFFWTSQIYDGNWQCAQVGVV
jgi:hypothetical protein